MHTALSIAGSDCSGGAGIQADLKTMAALGVYGMSVVTSVVAENTRRVISSLEVPAAVVGDQIDAIFEDIGADAVKIGMLPSSEIMRTVSLKLKRHVPRHIVVDPVMCAKDGSALMREDAISTFIDVVLPIATLLTPNIPEAERITGMKISGVSDMKKAAVKMANMGAGAVLVKGGHGVGDCEDVFFDGNDFAVLTHKRIESKNTHGTGCTLSSAIAAYLALGKGKAEAVALGKEYVTGAISNGLNLGKGHGPMNHFFEFYGEK